MFFYLNNCFSSISQVFCCFPKSENVCIKLCAKAYCKNILNCLTFSLKSGICLLLYVIYLTCKNYGVPLQLLSLVFSTESPMENYRSPAFRQLSQASNESMEDLHNMEDCYEGPACQVWRFIAIITICISTLGLVFAFWTMAPTFEQLKGLLKAPVVE